MEWTGKVLSVGTDWLTGQMNITLSINERSALQEIDSIKDCEKLAIKAVKYRAKRSLDANALLWAMCTEIAGVVNSSKDDVYESMLQKYGYLQKDEEGYIVITVKANEDISKIPGHWKFYKSNDIFSSYLMIKGTSEYDTAEMAKFLDRVIEEAVELGIAPPTSKEMQRALEQWEKQYEKTV